MTLTEFLLARIAEDEASATNWLRFEVRDGIPGNYAIPDRVLAECEAKRRIVGLIDPDRNRWSVRNILGTLALPYADHPDYDEGWRP
jgi:hypothetical protein